MNGYCGKFLRVDLTTSTISTEKPTVAYYKKYLGGRGFIIHTLLNEVPKGIDPLGEKNKLIFALGPITGHAFMGSGRNSIGAKSPLSGSYGESEVGGFWGAELRKSGYDAIIIEGKSANPVYLWIKDGKAEIKDAQKMWGLEIAPTEKFIQSELGDNRIRVASIGPGGENLVRYACIANDISHFAGRTGLGAVMGSKKLKAIAVRGNNRPKIANSQGIKELSVWMTKNFKEKTNIWKFGTGATIDKYEESGNLPIKNFNGGRFPGVCEITPQKMFEKGYIKKMEGCFACPVRCKRKIRIDTSHKHDSSCASPEYETLAAFGANCLIDNLEALIKANEMCGRYGIDTISTGVVISFAMECYENGILTKKDTDGIDLTFGNADAMLAMVEKIATRKGIGDLLAEGTKKASKIIGNGSDEFAMHVKGLEIPMHEPRYKQGMGLHYGVHSTGADHCTGIHDDLISKNLNSWESLDVAEPIASTEMSPMKARMLYHNGLWRHLGNYLGLCFLVPWTHDQIKDAMQWITGWPMSNWRLMKAVERGITLTRIFNIREGFTEKDDNLPSRFQESPSEGPLKGINVNQENFSKSKKCYYEMLGWNGLGIPSYGRIIELDIEWAYKYLT